MDAELRLQDFSLEDYQDMISGTFRDFFEKECPTSLVRETEAAGFAPGLWRRLVEMGAVSMAFDNVASPCPGVPSAIAVLCD